jgi:stearoyl-CoA desaturase (delta-9 desaturase)
MENGTSLMFFFSFSIYILIALTVTSGYHRLFSHATYECNEFWKLLFGFIGTASLNSSPVEWASVHLAHHKFSDTESDPYDSTWRQFTKFKDRTGITAPRMVLRMMKSPVHRFWVKYSAMVAILTAMIALVFGAKVFLFLYALPVAGYLFASYLHNIIAHINKQPRNFWVLEFLIPMCGEWSHKAHHENARKNDFNDMPKVFDLGGYLIRAIRNDR